MKTNTLIIAFVAILLIIPFKVNGATLDIVGPALPLPTFTIDVFIQDADGLDDLDYWSLGLALSPEENAFFVGATGDNDPNYVFFGDSNDFGFTLLDEFHIVIADLTNSGAGVTNFVDKLLCSVMVDASRVGLGEIYEIEIFGEGVWTLFGDSDAGFAPNVSLQSPYTFGTPVPAAVWLFASGLVGMAAIRVKPGFLLSHAKTQSR